MTKYIRVDNKLIFLNGKGSLSYFDLVKHEFVALVVVKND